MGPDGTTRWPVIVLLHVGNYKGGDFYHSFSTAPEDLRDAGFYVIVADYPLAPPRSIKGQSLTDTNAGRYPQQTRAVEAIIDAAKNDLHCYMGLVGVLGGSAGASHAAYVALDVTNTGTNVWPFWNSTARPKCVVGLSGQYDFSDRDQDVIDNRNYIRDIENYTKSATLYTQWADSPVGLVSTTSTFIPMYFLRSMSDSGSPASTQDYLWLALTQAQVDPALFRMWSVPPAENSDHAFALWQDYTDDTFPNQGLRVKDRVISFFQQYLHP